MLTIHFKPGFGAPIVLDPVPYARLCGRWLCLGPGDRRLARYEDNTWTYGAVSFDSMAIYQPVRLRFEAPDGQVLLYGPYEGVRVANNELYVGNGVGQTLARLDEDHEVWSVVDPTTKVPDVLIVPADHVRPNG